MLSLLIEVEEKQAKRAQTKKLTAQVSLDVGQNYNEMEETRRAELSSPDGGTEGVARTHYLTRRFPQSFITPKNLLECDRYVPYNHILYKNFYSECDMQVM